MAITKWSSEQIPDQKGRLAIVTGSSSGLGKETARVLATKNATVILAVRNLEKGQKVTDQILKEHPSAEVAVRVLDLGNLNSVKSFADSITEDYDHLDVLINNAGVMMCPYSQTGESYGVFCKSKRGRRLDDECFQATAPSF